MCTFPYPYCPSRAGKPGRRAVKGSWAKRDMLQLGEILTFQALFLLRLIVFLVSVLYKNIWFLYLCVSPLIILMTPGLINGCGEHYINVPLHPAPDQQCCCWPPVELSTNFHEVSQCPGEDPLSEVLLIMLNRCLNVIIRCKIVTK